MISARLNIAQKSSMKIILNSRRGFIGEFGMLSSAIGTSVKQIVLLALHVDVVRKLSIGVIALSGVLLVEAKFFGQRHGLGSSIQAYVRAISDGAGKVLQ